MFLEVPGGQYGRQYNLMFQGSGSNGGEVLFGCMEMSYFYDVNFESEVFLRIFLFRPYLRKYSVTL